MPLLYSKISNPVESILKNLYNSNDLIEKSGLSLETIRLLLEKPMLSPLEYGYSNLEITINSHTQFDGVSGQNISPSLYASLPSIEYIEKYSPIIQLLNLASPLPSRSIAHDPLNETCKILSAITNIGVVLPLNPPKIDETTTRQLNNKSKYHISKEIKRLKETNFEPFLSVLAQVTTNLTIMSEWTHMFRSAESDTYFELRIDECWEELENSMIYQAIKWVHPKTLFYTSNPITGINFELLGHEVSRVTYLLSSIDTFESRRNLTGIDYYSVSHQNPNTLMQNLLGFKRSS
jgi:hypothetical protein